MLGTIRFLVLDSVLVYSPITILKYCFRCSNEIDLGNIVGVETSWVRMTARASNVSSKLNLTESQKAFLTRKLIYPS